MGVEFGLSIATRIALYVGLFWFGIWKGRNIPVADLKIPSATFGPMTSYFAMPYLESGQISVAMLLILAVTSFKYLLEAVLQTA